MLKIIVKRRGSSVYGNPFYTVIGLEGTEKEIQDAYNMDIIRDYKKGTELLRNSSYVYTVNNDKKEITKGKRKVRSIVFKIVDEWHV